MRDNRPFLAPDPSSHCINSCSRRRLCRLSRQLRVDCHRPSIGSNHHFLIRCRACLIISGLAALAVVDIMVGADVAAEADAGEEVMGAEGGDKC